MVPVMCGGCGLRGTVALAKLAAAANPQCPRCGSRDLDLADEMERTAELGEPVRKDCPKCGSNSLMKVSRSDGKQVWNCAQCRYQEGTDKPVTIDAAKTAFTDPPMDVLKDTDRVIEQVTCSNCLQSFNHAAGDPADPLPPCPNCGSMATSVAGGGATRAASLDAKAAELVDAIRATNPGMTRGAAQRLAYRTIERFPRVAGLTSDSSHATVPLSTEEMERRRQAPAPDDMEDMPHAIDRLLHNRWHTPA